MKTVFLEIAIFAITLTIIKMLIPENTFKNQMNFLLSVVFLLGTIFFITGGDYDLGEVLDSIQKETAYVDFSHEVTNQRKREIAKELGKRVREKLILEKIPPEEISVIINISEQGRISINEIKLVFAEGVDIKKAETVVMKETGGTIKITIKKTASKSKQQRTVENEERFDVRDF